MCTTNHPDPLFFLPLPVRSMLCSDRAYLPIKGRLQTPNGPLKGPLLLPNLIFCSSALTSCPSQWPSCQCTPALHPTWGVRTGTAPHLDNFSLAFGCTSSFLTQRSPSQIPDFLSLGDPQPSIPDYKPLTISSTEWSPGSLPILSF